MPLGDAPNYSTPRTLGLAVVSVLGALAHFALGAAEYSRAGRYVGLAEMIVAALLLVYGVLTVIRYAEAQDALHDPHPRTPMYATPHEWLTYWVGLGLNGAGALICALWLLRSELPAWHVGGLLLGLLGVGLAQRSRPQPDED